jgi:hypothetical protein
VSDEDVRRTRLRIGGWLPSYDKARSARPKPVGGRASDDTTVTEPRSAAPPVEPIRTHAHPLSWRRRSALAGLTGLAALALLGFASIQRAGIAPATPGESPAGAAPITEPYWPVPDSLSPSAVPTGTASPGPGGTATPTASEKPGAPRRTSPGGAGITPAEPSVTKPAPALTTGSRIGLEPLSRPGYRVRHRDFSGRIDAIGPGRSAVDRADSTFTVRRGLAASGCVSFESVNFPGYYLRHRDFVIHLHRRDGSQLFAADATFCAVPGLAGRDISLRSHNYPSYYLYHRDTQLRLGTGATRAVMTFAVRSGP